MSGSDDMARPLFRRHVAANFRHWRAGADLSIEPGRITLKASRVLATISGQTEVVHTNRDVRWVKTRLTVPWMYAHLIVEGVGGTAAVNVVFGQKEIRSALRDAGFNLIEEKTWFSVGGRFVK
jgi:hypothetical protein